MYVVSQTSEDDGLGGRVTDTYSYSQGKFHLQGWNWLGFATELAYNEASTLYQLSLNSQDFTHYLHHRVVSGGSYFINSEGLPSYISNFTNTWISRGYVNDLGQHSFVVNLDSQQTTSYGAKGDYLYSKNTAYTYDGFNNVLTIHLSQFADSGM